MFISGSLKRRAVEFYREQITDFDYNSFYTSDLYFSYDGCLVFNKLGLNDSDKLRTRQEDLINKGIDNTLRKAHDLDVNSALVAIELDKLQMTPRRISYALFECFYSLVIHATDSDDFKIKAYKFAKFREYLCSLGEVTQWELDIMINLFMRGLSYKPWSVAKEERRVFGIEENNSDNYINTINLGKFIAPERVANIAPEINSHTPDINYSAPFYFALKDPIQAEAFLNWWRQNHFIREELLIEQNIPETLAKLVRKIDISELPF